MSHSKKTPKGLKAFLLQCPLGWILLITLLAVAVFGFYVILKKDSSPLRLLKGEDSYVATALKGEWVSADEAVDGQSLLGAGETSAEETALSSEPEPLDDASEAAEASVPEESSDTESALSGEASEEASSESSEETAEESSGELTEESSEPEPVVINTDPFQWVSRDPIEPRASTYDDPQRLALTTYAEYETVTEEYFDDVLFIGDSRVEGLSLYGYFLDADYAYLQGTGIFQCFYDPLVYVDDGWVVDREAYLSTILSQETYGKIYIMLGINDLTSSTADEFSEYYWKVINHIWEYQPDALIFICAIMNVTTAYSDASDSVYINNDSINSRNYRIAQLADGERVFYLDENTAMNDETGGLNADYTNDGVHPTAENYIYWHDFLLEHGIPEGYQRPGTATEESVSEESLSEESDTDGSESEESESEESEPDESGTGL